MGNAIRILGGFFREFIPSLKIECIIIGITLIVMSICLIVVAESSGLSGKLTYLVLHPGTTVPGILGGLLLIAAAMFMKPIPRDQW